MPFNEISKISTFLYLIILKISTFLYLITNYFWKVHEILGSSVISYYSYIRYYIVQTDASSTGSNCLWIKINNMYTVSVAGLNS